MDRKLFNRIVRTAHADPKLRPHLLPIIKEARQRMKGGSRIPGAITSVRQINPRRRYTIWERPRGGVWLVDRSYYGTFFQDNWDDLWAANRRTSNEMVILPEGMTPPEK